MPRRLTCPCAHVDNHQSRKCCQVLFYTVSAILCAFFLSPLKGGISFCTVVASYGHVSLIVDQLDLLVTLLWSGREITGESLRNLKMHSEGILVAAVAPASV